MALAAGDSGSAAPSSIPPDPGACGGLLCDVLLGGAVNEKLSGVGPPPPTGFPSSIFSINANQ
jgi:hypothetical protein